MQLIQDLAVQGVLRQRLRASRLQVQVGSETISMRDQDCRDPMKIMQTTHLVQQL